LGEGREEYRVRGERGKNGKKGSKFGGLLMSQVSMEFLELI